MIGAVSKKPTRWRVSPRCSAGPFVSHLTDRARAVLPPQANPGPAKRKKRALLGLLSPLDRLVESNRHNRSDRAAMPADDCGLPVLGKIEERRKRVSRFLCAFGRRFVDLGHLRTVRNRTGSVNKSFGLSRCGRLTSCATAERPQ